MTDAELREELIQIIGNLREDIDNNGDSHMMKSDVLDMLDELFI